MQNQSGQQTFQEVALHLAVPHQILFGAGGNAQMGIDTWRTGLFDMNPSQGTTGGAYYGPVSIPNNDKVFVRFCQAEMTLKNFSNIDTEATVYWFTPKMQSALVPSSVWLNSLNDRALGKATAAAPILPAGTETTGVPDITSVGLSPNMEPTFRRIMRTIRAIRVRIPAGGSHVFKYKIHYNKYVDRSMMNQLNNNSISRARGYTVSVCVLSRPGVVMHETTAGDGTVVTRQPSIGIVELGVLYTHRYFFQSVGQSRVDADTADLQFVSQPVTSGTTNPGVFDKVMDVVDQVVSVASA